MAVPQALTERVKGLALAVGFDLAGVAPAEPAPHAGFLHEWIARGYAGEMDYIARRAAERVDPSQVLGPLPAHAAARAAAADRARRRAQAQAGDESGVEKSGR